jgi:hypothetical protein
MRRVLWQGMLAVVLGSVAILGVQALLGGGGAGQASPAVSLGVDADPDGNTATSLGTIDPCVSVGVGDTFTIDVFIRDVEDLQVWHVFVRYDPSLVNISDRNVAMFLAAAPGSDVRDGSYGDPDLSGAYDLLASDVADDPPYETGSGVLARLTFTATSPGLTAIGIDDPILWGYPLHLVAVGSIVNAWVAVGQECPSEPPPTPTPTPTPAPTPTPPPTPIVGADVDPTGNTATSLGPIDSCLSVSTGATFDIDVFVQGVTLLRVWNVALHYDPSVVTVVDRHIQMFLAANPGSDAVDYSYGDPSVGGAYELTAADLSEEETAHESGSGVLVRLTLMALGPGLSPAALSGVFLFAYPVQPVAVNWISGGQIAVDRGCGPDGDLDGWPDEIDNCPDGANPDHTDTDGDRLGDACDDDDDGDGWTDVDENAIGTDALDRCTDEAGDLDAWPPDINQDTSVNILDVLLYKPRLQQGAAYDRRYDLNTDGRVNILDPLLYKQVLGMSCANP